MGRGGGRGFRPAGGGAVQGDAGEHAELRRGPVKYHGRIAGEPERFCDHRAGERKQKSAADHKEEKREKLDGACLPRRERG